MKQAGEALFAATLLNNGQIKKTPPIEDTYDRAPEADGFLYRQASLELARTQNTPTEPLSWRSLG